MSKCIKIWLIAAAALLWLGGIVFVGGMAALHWDFTKLSTSKYETNEYTVTETFGGLAFIANTADIKLVPSENGECKIVCYEQTNQKHTVAVRSGTLTVEVVDTRQWYEHIGINFGAPRITVYMPAGAYGALSVRSDTGNVDIPADFRFESMDIAESTGNVTSRASVAGAVRIGTTTGSISLENVSAGEIELSVTTGRVTALGVSCAGDMKVNVSTGDAELSDVSCRSLISDGSTGDAVLRRVIAAERLSVTRSTGFIWLEATDAAELCLKTDTGDVKGTLLSEKVFHAHSDTGYVNVPRTVTGGRCEITTDTGDIEITIAS